MKSSYFKILYIIIYICLCANARADLSLETRSKLSADLNGYCASLFTGKKGSLARPEGGYQDHDSANRVFVFAYDGNGHQACSYRQGGLFTKHQELQDNACSYLRVNGFVNCFLYAKDDNIVYEASEDLIEKAKALYKQNKFDEAWQLVELVKSRGGVPVRGTALAKFYYLEGVRAIKDENFSKAIDSLAKSWSNYGYIESAEAELDLLTTQDLNQNWKKIREVYGFLKDKDDKPAIVKYEQLFTSTSDLYNADQLANENIAREAKEQKIIEAKKAEERAIIEAKEAKERAIIEAKEAKIAKEQERKRLAEEAREEKKLAELQKPERLRAEKEAREQERKRLAEERRIAREGDGSSDDLTCKSFGAKPGTQPYITCRINLSGKVQREQQAQQQAQQQEWSRKLQAEQLTQEQTRQQALQYAEQDRLRAEQERRYQQQLELQESMQVEQKARQDAADRQRKLDGLELIFRALQGTGGGSASPSTPTMPHFLRSQYYSNGSHMCNYDDGTVLNVGAGICPNTR